MNREKKKETALIDHNANGCTCMNDHKSMHILGAEATCILL